MNIFDLVTSAEITAYWTRISAGDEPFLGEELFPNKKQGSLTLKWIVGAKGLPVTLKPSQFDVRSVPRPRITFDKISADMPFFKESKYIDEEMRQELNKVLATNVQAYIDSVLLEVFDDEVSLIRSASVARERMRMQLLTSGVIEVSGNGVAQVYDYGIPTDHKAQVTTAWSNPDADIFGDIQAGIDKIVDDSGTRPTRAICNTKTWRNLKNNNTIKRSIYVLTNGIQAPLSDATLRQHIMDDLSLSVSVYDKRYSEDGNNSVKYIPDDTFILIPDGTLGNTVFGVTPEESDLLSSNVANVRIVDMGVAVTTIKKADPVNVETKVSMVCLISFPSANEIYILDTSV